MSQHHPGKFYVQEAEKHGIQVKAGHGDHMVLIAPAGRGYMTVPCNRKDLANGTEHSIKKWFAALGILVTIIAGIICHFEQVAAAIR